MKRFLFLIALLITATDLPADRLVFDMPEVHTQHLTLLSMMNDAHTSGDYYAMSAICYKGINLNTSNSLWTYNLACALSLQENPEESIETLKEAIKLGFYDIKHMKKDTDLENLRERDDFKQIIEELEETVSAEGYTNSTLRGIIALSPDSDNTVMQTETNTIWNFSTALFHTFISLQQINATPDKMEQQPAYMIYVNRDNNSSDVEFGETPGILKLTYCDEMQERRQHIGAPNTLFINESNGGLIPAIGNSSMGFINSEFWRCQPRALFTDPDRIQHQVIMLLGNQLYCYPTYSDYRIATGDLFPANTPYYVAVSGSSKSEQLFTKALADTIAALTPETRLYLTNKGLLMPTVQVLLRKSQRAVTSPDIYMSGIAHPAAFQPKQLDTAKLLSNARALTTNNIPPLILIQVEDKSELNQSLDMPTCVYSENLFSTHLAAARIFRAFPYKRKYRVKTLCRERNAKIHCVLLQGDKTRVSINRNSEDPNEWLIEVAHHGPFMTAAAGGKPIMTTRVDVGFFAEAGSGISLPSILSVSFLGNETRIYDKQERLLSIDYRRHTTPYTDPLLSYPRNWKDEFRHDKEGRITGWTRIRPRKKEQFTAYGDLAIEFDDKGRATKARRIAYTKRYIGNTNREGGTLPSLAQVDDNIELHYSYTSDDDYIGKPDSETTRNLEPPVQRSE